MKMHFSKILSSYFEKLTKKHVVIGLTSVGTIGTLYCSVKSVPAGHISYQNLFGNIGSVPLKSGLHVVNPFATLIEMPLLINSCTSHINVASNEGLALTVKVDVIYKLNSERTRDVYLSFKHNYKYILIEPVVQSVLRNVMAGYEAKALYKDSTRNTIKEKISSEINDKLSQYGIIICDIMINDICLPKQLHSAIESKLEAEQQNEQMEFTIQKKRKEIAFTLEQEKMEAERKIIEANGIKEFQDIVSKGISDKLIQWKGIEATKEIAKSNNSKIVIVGNNSTGSLPFVMSSQ